MSKELDVFKGLTVEETLTIVEREKSKRSLYSFFLYCMENIYRHIEFEDNWHYREICNVLQKEVERMERREPTKHHLLINLPIRCGKTILISEVFPCWLWIKDQSLQVQNVCATQRLATKSSRMSRLIMTSDWFQSRFPEVQLADDHKSKSDYGTVDGGNRASYGIGSSIIGSNYDVLVVDDPNDPTDANSDVSIRNVTETFTDVIAGRANNDWALRVILQQRTSGRDLCGFLLDNNASDYRHICIPAELTKDTTPEFRKHYKDGLFFPARYGWIRLEKYKSDLSGQAYASQLLQAPSSLEGEIILRSWFPVIKQSEFNKIKKGKLLLFADTAYTANEKDNDPNGYYVCMESGGKIYVLKAYEKWQEFYESLQEIIELIKTYGIKKCYIESKATGISIQQELRRSLRGRVGIFGVNPGSKSKVERARACQPYMVDARVILVEDLWNEAFLTQLANFPFGKHDSHIDNLTYSIITLIAGKKLKKPDPEKPSNPVDTSDFDDNLYS